MATQAEKTPVKTGNGGRASHPLLTLREDIDRMFDEFVSGWPSAERWKQMTPFGYSGGFGKALSPEVDISETDDAYEITAELPGISEQDIDVTLSDDTLTLSAEKKEEREEKEKNYYLSERSYGRFQRSFMLPADVNADKIATAYRQGVLTITVPKSPEAKSKVRKIKVKSA